MIKNPAYSLKTTGICLLALMIGFSSCKNKKKVKDLADPVEVKAQIEEEINSGQYDPPKTEPEPRVAVKEPTKTERLNDYFRAVASAPSSTSANGSITEALSMFSSPDAPVLIVIYQANGTTDYDEPTTIRKYLEYVKDTKNAAAVVEEMVMDNNGRIKELVLRKK